MNKQYRDGDLNEKIALADEKRRLLVKEREEIDEQLSEVVRRNG